MSTPFEPIPQRIGEQERNDAVGLLQEHLGAGRLDHAEFDDRIGKALAAKTADDLQRLFTDLPGRKPGQELARAQAWQPPEASPQPAQPPAQQAGPSWLTPGLTSALVPIAVVLCFIFGFKFWWLIVIAALVASGMGKRTYDQRSRRGCRNR